MGTQCALVVHGADGLDELSVTGVNKITQLHSGKITTYYLDPKELDLPRAELASLKGGLPADNAAIMRALLQGESGPKRDTVLLNAAAGLLVAGKASDYREGLSLAAESIDSGKALDKLEQFIRLSNTLGEKNGS
jgi:anthranilate phosphoribosyltransferase